MTSHYSRAHRFLQQTLVDADPFSAAFAALAKLGLPPNQKRLEIVEFLRLVEPMRPRRLLEIGTGNGSSTLLLSLVCAYDAVVITCDRELSEATHELLQTHMRGRQQILPFQADSHDPSFLQKVRSIFGEPPDVDVLFIDGDHYGVEQDYTMYSPLVRRGGLVAFHDIVEHSTHPPSVGYVPGFWKSRIVPFATTSLIVEDAAQDGYGIGVVFV